MPELPEVETIVRDIAPHLEGATLHDPRLYHPHVLRETTPRAFLRAVRDQRVQSVTRRAKHAVLHLASGHRIIVQPRMTGSLLILRAAPSGEDRRYAIFAAKVGRGWFLVRDVRRLGTITLLDEPGWMSYTERIGPEPLAATFTAAHLAERLAGTRQAIKKVLMDQARVAGIGNIYANEALWRAGIDPSLPADQVDRAAIGRLYRHVRAVLRAALRSRGTTVRDYRTGTGQPGTYQDGLDVYDRAGLPCRRCDTVLATTHAIDGRQTTFCWRCQGSA